MSGDAALARSALNLRIVRVFRSNSLDLATLWRVFADRPLGSVDFEIGAAATRERLFRRALERFEGVLDDEGKIRRRDRRFDDAEGSDHLRVLRFSLFPVATALAAI